jgi:hypothetical protein
MNQVLNVYIFGRRDGIWDEDLSNVRVGHQPPTIPNQAPFRYSKRAVILTLSAAACDEFAAALRTDTGFNSVFLVDLDPAHCHLQVSRCIAPSRQLLMERKVVA